MRKIRVRSGHGASTAELIQVVIQSQVAARIGLEKMYGTYLQVRRFARRGSGYLVWRGRRNPQRRQRRAALADVRKPSSASAGAGR